jgi:hypothetical protein
MRAKLKIVARSNDAYACVRHALANPLFRFETRYMYITDASMLNIRLSGLNPCKFLVRFYALA